MKPRYPVMLMPMLLMNCAYPVDKASETPVKDEESFVSWNALGAEVGRFLLIRRDKLFCAVKITGVWRGNDATKPTMFNSGEESFRATYDWYYTPDYPKQWGTTAVLSGHGEVRRGALKGIGRLAFQTVNGEIECGTMPMKFSWHPPTSISFYGVENKFYGPVRQGDYGYEMALTKWRDVMEIKPDAPYLKWYRYDENREPITIRTDGLW